MKSKQKKHQVKELDTLLNVFTPTGFEHRKYCNIRTMTGGDCPVPYHVVPSRRVH